MGRVPEKRMSWTEVADRRDAMEKQAAQQGRQQSQKIAKKERKVTAEALYRKLQRQQFRCALSGVLMEPDDASLDHIVPLSKGGEHNMDNVQVVHKDVNRMKGQMSQEEMVNWCRKIAQWNA